MLDIDGKWEGPDRTNAQYVTFSGSPLGFALSPHGVWLRKGGYSSSACRSVRIFSDKPFLLAGSYILQDESAKRLSSSMSYLIPVSLHVCGTWRVSWLSFSVASPASFSNSWSGGFIFLQYCVFGLVRGPRSRIENTIRYMYAVLLTGLVVCFPGCL